MHSRFRCNMGNVLIQFFSDPDHSRDRKSCGLDVEPEVARHDGQKLRIAQQQTNKTKIG